MKRLQRGILIALEGIDGSGKSTLARALETAFKSYGIPVTLTKQPGATTLGKEIRNAVQSAQYEITPLAETLLFAADRAQHIVQVVKPALERSELVISDRMADSTRAYQGFGRNIDKKRLEDVTEWVMQGVTPDVTLYLVLDVDHAIQRIQNRKMNLTRFEKLDRSFYERLVYGFESIYKGREDVIRLDALSDEHSLAKTAFNELTKRLIDTGLLLP